MKIFCYFVTFAHFSTYRCTAFTARWLMQTRPLLSPTLHADLREAQTLVNLVHTDDFVRAIDILKRDMGITPTPDEQRPPMYAIGKLVASLPLEHVSGIRLADCEFMTLISQIKQNVADITGIQSLDTIVAIRAGHDGNGGYGYECKTNGSNITITAAVYTAAVAYARENEVKEIELEINRLVPMMSTDA